MIKAKRANFQKHIEPLNMNGLHGRVLNLPAPKRKNKQILLVYGHHASIERMSGLAQELNRYGAISMPDLPGFGGMQSLYKLGEKPTIDALADYLAAYVKMRYKNRRFTAVGMSFGLVVITRMLQRCPDIAKKVDDVVSLVGFVHHEDFKMKPSTKRLLSASGQLLSFRVPAILSRYVLLNRPMIYLGYLLVGDRNVKMYDASRAERLQRIAFEVDLWQANDVRTYGFTGRQMLKANLCDYNGTLELPLTHVMVEDDRYFDNRIVSEHLSIIYKDVSIIKTSMKGHAPTVISSTEQVSPLIPKQLRSLLKGTI